MWIKDPDPDPVYSPDPGDPKRPDSTGSGSATLITTHKQPLRVGKVVSSLYNVHGTSIYERHLGSIRLSLPTLLYFSKLSRGYEYTECFYV